MAWMRRSWPTVLTWTLIGALTLVMAYPIWLTVAGGFQSRSEGGGFTLHHVASVFTDPMLREGLVNSLLIALCTTTLSMLIAVPLSIVTVRYDYPLKKVFGAMILAPMILPPFVGAIGLQHLLGRNGAVNALLGGLGLLGGDSGVAGGGWEGIDFIGRGGFWAIVIIEALYLYPIAYLNATAALANLDPALEEAAAMLGGSKWNRLRRIVLPLMRPGLLAGGVIVFIWSFTELGTPLMFDYQRVTPVQIFNGIKEMDTSRQPYALTAVMLACAAGCYLLGKLVLGGGKSYAMQGRAAVGTRAAALRGWRGWLACAMFGAVICAAVLPHVSVMLASLSSTGAWYRSVVPAHMTAEHYVNALGHELAVGSIRNSLGYASVAVLIDLVLGLMIGYLVVRTRAIGRHVLDAMAMLPLAVPGLVMAFGYVAMSLRWPFREGDPLAGFVDILGAEPNPIPLLILAYAVRRLPYVVRSTVAGLQQTSVDLEEAALNLGAGRLRAVRTVVVPLIAANLIAGGLLAFSFAMLEVSDSLILAQREVHFPITKAIYVLFERLGDGKAIASAMGVWGMALLAVTLTAASVMMGKKMGAVFRV